MGRAPCCDKTTVKRGPWSPEEDAKLKSYIQENGTGGNWIALPQKIGLKRCGKSCRLRWLNYLRPNIKHGSFSEDEDYIICTLYLNIGSRWSIIASQLPGRTDNDIKNYWNTKLKKKLTGMQRNGHQLSKKGGLVKQEMKGEILGDLKSQPLSMNMNLYESSHWPIEFPLILTNPSQEHHGKTEDPTFNHYPFNTNSSQPEFLDQCSKKHTQIISDTPYFDNGDAMNLVPEFNTYPLEINEHNYINAQFEHFDGLVCGFDNVFNRSICTSSSAQSSTSMGDLLAYPHPHLYHQICPPEEISQFQ